MIDLFDHVDFRFQVNYHSFGELLLYTFGFQVNTPSADDPIYVALSGTDTKPAIDGFNPGVGADLYTTNGETTDFAHAQHDTLAWTPELGDGPHNDGFVFPDKEGQIQNEFVKTLPFDLDVALSAADPDNPVSHLKIEVEPFYLNVAAIDPAEEPQPAQRLPFRVLVQRRQSARADPGQTGHRQRRKRGHDHRPLVDQRRAAPGRHRRRVARWGPLRRAGRCVLPHRRRDGHGGEGRRQRDASGSRAAVRRASRSPTRW